MRHHRTAVAAALTAAAVVVTTAAPAGAVTSAFLPFAHFVLGEFGTDQSWQAGRHPRMLADVDGDGRADIVGFGDAGVYIARANGAGGFAGARFTIPDFGFDQGWRVNYEPPVAPTPRFATDITGDGRADIVGIGNAGVYTAVAAGNGSYFPVTFQFSGFTASGCFGGAFAADVNADGRSDLLCLRWNGTVVPAIDVATALGNGGFAAPKHATTEALPNGTVYNFRDVTADRRADLLAVTVNRFPFTLRTANATSNGTYPLTRAGGATFSSGSTSFVFQVADVNGDGCADLVAFSDVAYRALGRCDGTFLPYQVGANDFGSTSGWDHFFKHVGIVTDVTGDGRADVVGFGNAGVYTALGQSNGTFGPTQFVVSDLGYDEGWRIPNNPRFVADITGDGRPDIVGFGNAGVYTAIGGGDGSFG
jgi:hypothetical protein